MNLSLTIISTTARSACVQVAGDLVYETVDNMVDTVAELLSQQATLKHLHLDLSALSFCDSAGLSGLLLVHRRSAQADVQLHLDQRPAFLDRILDVTGTFDHLVTASVAEGETSADHRGKDAAEESQVR